MIFRFLDTVENLVVEMFILEIPNMNATSRKRYCLVVKIYRAAKHL